MNDELLIKIIKERKSDGIEILYRENYKMIFSLAFKITGSKEDAEEILQETFLKAIKKINKFNLQENGSLKSWLLKICSNLSIDYLRKRRIKNIFLMNIFRSEKANYYSSREINDNANLKESFEYAISKLSPKQRIAFILKHLEGYSLKEISKIMGVSENTTKEHLKRSVTKIKKYLSGVKNEKS